MRFAIKARIRKYVEWYRFLYLTNMRKDRLRLLKELKHKKKLLQKTEELIGNIIVEKFVKPKPPSGAKPSDVEEIVPSSEKRKEILSNLTLIKNGTSENI